MADTLLPPSASLQERAIEQTIIRASDFHPNYVQNWVPFDVPENILPWLAWAYSVDEWSVQWPTDVRREYTEQSYFIHRHKGTVAAVRRALSSVIGGDEMTLEEWWQYDGPVHTFTVTAEAFDLWLRDGPPLSPELYRQIRALVYASKPVRSHWTLRVRMPSEAGIGAAGAFTSAAVVTGANALKRPPIAVKTEIQAGGANTSAAVVTGQTVPTLSLIRADAAVQSACAATSANVITSANQATPPAIKAAAPIVAASVISPAAVVAEKTLQGATVKQLRTSGAVLGAITVVAVV